VEEAVFLGDRVAVMTFRPGRVKEVISVPIERPRTLDILKDESFIRTQSQVWETLREESAKAFHTYGHAA